jgi:hypothetical protein
MVRVRLTARGARGLFSRRAAENGVAEGEKRQVEAIDDWVEVVAGGQNSTERV